MVADYSESTINTKNGQYVGRIGRKTGKLTPSSKKSWFIDIDEEEIQESMKVCAFFFHLQAIDVTKNSKMWPRAARDDGLH